MSNKKKSTSYFFLKKIELEQGKRTNIQKSGTRDKEPNLLNLSHALDNFYFFEKLKLYANFLSYQMIIHDDVIGYQEEEFKLLHPILELVMSKKNLHPTIKLYFLLCQLLQISLPKIPTNSAKELTLLKTIEELIDENLDNIPKGDLIEIYSHLTSYSIYQINNGEDFFKKGITYNHYLIKLEEENNKDFSMNVGVYKNMVTLILKIQNIENCPLEFLGHKYISVTNWAHQFADQYKKKLPKTDRKKYYHYCKALILFQEKEFYEAYLEIKDLERVRAIFINFDLKVLQLQLLLELEIKENQLFDAQQIETEDEIEKLRSMLNYNKNENSKLGYQANYFHSFLMLFRSFYAFYRKNFMMFNFGDQKYHQQRNTLQQNIINCKYSYKNWFLEKLEEIK